jgi:creatinine amidohydrolase
MVNKLPELKLANISGHDFAAAAAENPVILLPLGSHEDHGPFLPMGDYVLAEILAVKVASLCRESGLSAFVAPALPFGVADYFGSSPGGLALSASTFRGVLSDLLGCLLRHKLTRIVILNGHGGNVPVIHDVTLAINLAGGPVIPSIYLWKIARLLMERRIGQGAAFGHGAEPLLSLTMAARPNDVATGAPPEDAKEPGLGLPVTDFGVVTFDGIPINVPAEFDKISDHVAREARQSASASLGKAVETELARLAAKFILHYVTVT